MSGEKPPGEPSVIDYEAAVREGKEITTQIELGRDRLMRLGELADGVEKGYGEKRLDQFACDIGMAACTLMRCRSVYRAWHVEDAPKEAPAPKSYAVAQELQSHPRRFDLIKDKPNLTKREARKLVREHKAQVVTEDGWLRDHTKRWLAGACQHATQVIRDAAFVDSKVTPELR